jgi:predicted dienelactone hydrolase
LLRRSTLCLDAARLLFLSVILSALLLQTWRAAAQTEQLPYAQAGAYAVGVRIVLIESDPSRILRGFLWYPAQADAQFAYAEYGYGKRSATARQNAPPARDGAPYPLIIFSHGYGGYAAQSIYLTEHLASHGFAVLAINHNGSTLGDTDSETGLTLGWYLRPRDVLSQIAWAEALNADPQSDLYSLFDLDQIGVSGHSYGGYTALAAAGAQLDFRALDAYCAQARGINFACLAQSAEAILTPILPQDAERGTLRLPADPRVAAVLALAPFNAPIMGAQGLAAVRAPTFVMVGTADDVTPPERDAYPIYEQVGAAQKALLSFEGAQHLIFSDCMPRLANIARCNDAVWEAARAHAIVKHFATAFFLATLKADPAAQQALIAAPDLEAVRYQSLFR